MIWTLLSVAQATEWKSEPYLRPRANLVLYESGSRTDSIVGLGAEAGLRYWQKGAQVPWWSGRTRAAVTWGFGSSDVRSNDVRVGSFMGPTLGILRLESGLDVFRNELTVGGVGLDPSVGVGLPLVATVSVDVAAIWAGVETAWLADDNRRVDWAATDAFGVGHEFATLAGISLGKGPLLIMGQYTHRVVATGIQRTIGVGLAL